MNTEKYTIKRVTTREQYEGLRALWCSVFGDAPAYVDHMYRSFGMDPDRLPTDGAPQSAPDNTLQDSVAPSNVVPSMEIAGYIVTTASDNPDETAGCCKVVSALTCYKCGYYTVPQPESEEEETVFELLNGKPVYVSYAICTDPAYRGQGLAGALTEHVRNRISSEGWLSIVSPAEPDLEAFYQNLGYTQHFYADHGVAFSAKMMADEELMELAFDDDDDVTIWGEDMYGEFADDDDASDEEWQAFDPGMKLMPVEAAKYNLYREAFLADVPHIALTERMAEFIKSESADGNGLYLINNGDAICVLQNVDSASDNSADEKMFAAELLANPMLIDVSLEINVEIASRLADQYSQDRFAYRTVGGSRCQTMMALPYPYDQAGMHNEASGQQSQAGIPPELSEYLETVQAYYGFPID